MLGTLPLVHLLRLLLELVGGLDCVALVSTCSVVLIFVGFIFLLLYRYPKVDATLGFKILENDVRV